MTATPAGDYALYLWNHINTVAWWARNMKIVDKATVSFTRDDHVPGLHFFTRRDLLIGAQRAAHYLLRNPLTPQLESLPLKKLVKVLNGQWDNAPTDRAFVALALQLAVFDTVQFPLTANQSDLLSA